MRVSEIMSQPVIACQLGCTLEAPARLMWEHDCGTIPVLATDGRIAGIVTDRDICMAAYLQGRPLQEIPIETAMTRDVRVARGDDLLEQAEQVMRDRQIRRIPVADTSGRAVGVLSLNDLARHADGRRAGRIDREVVETLAGISQPRSRDQAALGSVN